eukprot:6307049-Lingulodinium_polyedra.AAC.1
MAGGSSCSGDRANSRSEKVATRGVARPYTRHPGSLASRLLTVACGVHATSAYPLRSRPRASGRQEQS